MKRIIAVLLCVVCLFSFGGCMSFFVDEEHEAYEQMVNDLFYALDNKDADAVYNLFSRDVQSENQNLKQKIDELISVYSGPTDEIGWDGLLAGGASYDSGAHSKDAYATFPVRCGDTYYWCYLNLMYENTFDKNQIGIVKIDFYTADEYCLVSDSEQAALTGLDIYAKKTVDGYIRCIGGEPYICPLSAQALSLDDVKDFFKNSNSLADFKARFGEPYVQDIYIYYELPQENGEPRFLRIGTDYDGTIYSASIVDDFMHIETVFDGE